MKLPDIKPGLWYATTLGIGECVGVILERIVEIKIDGVSRRVRPRDVLGETKKPEVKP